MHRLRLDREAAFEVAAHGHGHAVRERSKVRQRGLQRHAIVSAPDRPREPRAGCRQRLESKTHERPRAAEIPRVGNHETATVVKTSEYLTLFGEVRHQVTAIVDRSRAGAVSRPRAGSARTPLRTA